jgi:hypothetical protein
MYNVVNAYVIVIIYYALSHVHRNFFDTKMPQIPNFYPLFLPFNALIPNSKPHFRPIKGGGDDKGGLYIYLYPGNITLEMIVQKPKPRRYFE